MGLSKCIKVHYFVRIPFYLFIHRYYFCFYYLHRYIKAIFSLQCSSYLLSICRLYYFSRTHITKGLINNINLALVVFEARSLSEGVSKFAFFWSLFFWLPDGCLLAGSSLDGSSLCISVLISSSFCKNDSQIGVGTTLMAHFHFRTSLKAPTHHGVILPSSVGNGFIIWMFGVAIQHITLLQRGKKSNLCGSFCLYIYLWSVWPKSVKILK